MFRKNSYSKRGSSQNFFMHMGQEKTRQNRGSFQKPRHTSYEEPLPELEGPGTVNGMRFFNVERSSNEDSPKSNEKRMTFLRTNYEVKAKNVILVPQIKEDVLDSLRITGMPVLNNSPWHEQVIRSNGFKDAAITALSSGRKSKGFE